MKIRKFLLSLLLVVNPFLFSPLLYTTKWINYSASIVAGETSPDYSCRDCHKIIACTLIHDAENRIERNITPYTLYPDRWYGWRDTNEMYKEFVLEALEEGCDEFPVCQFLGNKSDYYNHFRYLSAVTPFVVEDTIFCVPFEEFSESRVFKYANSLNSVVYYR